MSTPARWIAWLVGAVLLIGAPTAWYVSQPPTSAGELPEGMVVEGPGTIDEPATTTEAPPTITEASPAAPAASPGDPTTPERAPEPSVDSGIAATDPASERPAKPVSVSLPGIGVSSADAVEVGLDANRAVEIPDDVQEIGWYGKGPRPGEDGNAFMTSHVDSRTQGRGVLFDLRESEPGDPIIVTHADGSTTEWEVVARERIEKGSYPMEQVFRFDGPPGLVIDTCGGAFDPETGSYERIDVVYAVLAQG